MTLVDQKVIWNGVEHDGRHESLVDRETFDRVQGVLAAHALSGDHRYKRHHYLKGSLFCAHCGERMVYGLSRGRNGTQYGYFFCIGRVKRTGCPNRRNNRAEYLEEEVEREYAALGQEIQPQDIEATKEAIRAHFDTLRGAADRTGDEQRRRIARLREQRRKLLHLHYEQAMPPRPFPGRAGPPHAGDRGSGGHPRRCGRRV